MNPRSFRVLTLLFMLVFVTASEASIVSAGPSPAVHLDLAAMVLRPSDFVAVGIGQECSREISATRGIPVVHIGEPLAPSGGAIPDRGAMAASQAERIQFTHHAATHRTGNACEQRQFRSSAVLEYRNETAAATGMDAMYNVWADSTKLVETKVTERIGDDAFYMEGSFRGPDRETEYTRAMLVFQSGNIVSVIVITSASSVAMPDQADVEALGLIQLGRIRSELNGDLTVAQSIASPRRQSHTESW